jgi:nucleotide-binding universal stress UspA family protein
MFNTIAVALDGSKLAASCIPFVTKLAERDSAKVVIVHVEERVAGKGGVVPLDATEPELRAALARKAQEMTDAGIATSVETDVVVLGGPAKPIADIADKVGADLIVVGSRGHSAVAGLFLGSVTERLLRIARQPVLVIPAAPAEHTD